MVSANDELPLISVSDSIEQAEQPSDSKLVIDKPDPEGLDSPEPKPDRHVPRAEEVMRASAAVDFLEPLILGRVRTKCELVDLARDGRITCYALRYWTEKMTEPSSIWQHPSWKSPPEEKVQRKIKIPRKLWMNADKLQDACLQWDWRQGRFYLCENLDSGKTKIHFIKGLWLLKDEVAAWKLMLNGGKDSVNRGGRPIKDPPAWTQFWLEIAAMAAENKISAITGRRYSKLISAVEKRFNERGERFPINIKDSSLKSPVSEILAQFPADDGDSSDDLGWDASEAE